ncbi:hypothetical protein ACLOJK_026235 [Asimina triloba]
MEMIERQGNKNGNGGRPMETMKFLAKIDGSLQMERSCEERNPNTKTKKGKEGICNEP